MTAVRNGWVSRTHKAIAPFELIRPVTIGAACAAHRDGAIYLAGGIDQIQRMKEGMRADPVISLAAVPDLAIIEESSDRLRLGAGVTHHRIETDPDVARLVPDLAAAWATVGNVRVRIAGTIGGNLLAADANYDGPVLLAVAGAQARFFTSEGDITVDLADAGGWPGEPGALLTEIAVPLPAERRLLFDRSLKPAISVAAAIYRDNTGAFQGRAAIGCATGRAHCAALDLSGVAAFADIGQRSSDLAAAFAGGLPDLRDDILASAAYRGRMARILLDRLLVRLAENEA